ncbi:hypothetical protein [Acinetobacter sp. ACNIH2]|nr:hypothetical protein [Acinetobacter sp. ACNIH2]
MSDPNQTNLTIGQLLELNQGKNPTQIADTEARARKAAKSLGLDYSKMTQTPEEISSVADEVNTQKHINDVVASDPVLGKYALDPNQAAISLDDFGGLKRVSDSVLLLKPSIAEPRQTVDYADIQEMFKKGTTPEQKKTLQKLGVFEDPRKQIQPKVPNQHIIELNKPLFPQSIEQTIEQQFNEIKGQYGVYAAARFKQYMSNQLYWANNTASAEPVNAEDQGNRYLNATKRGYASIWQTMGAAKFAVTGDASMLDRFTLYKNKIPQSNEMSQALSDMQLAAQTNDAGVLGAAQEF